jgi:hypothetical protein
MTKFQDLPTEMIDSAKAMIRAINKIGELKLTRTEWKLLDDFEKAVNNLPTIPDDPFIISVSTRNGNYTINLNDEIFIIEDYFNELDDRWQTTKWVVSTYRNKDDVEREGDLWRWNENLVGFIHLNIDELNVRITDYD